MHPMSEAEEKVVTKLVTGGARLTAIFLRAFACLALAVVALAVITPFLSDDANITQVVYVGLLGLFAATMLNAIAWIIDLLRGIVAGVWHDAYQAPTRAP